MTYAGISIHSVAQIEPTGQFVDLRFCAFSTLPVPATPPPVVAVRPSTPCAAAEATAPRRSDEGTQISGGPVFIQVHHGPRHTWNPSCSHLDYRSTARAEHSPLRRGRPFAEKRHRIRKDHYPVGRASLPPSHSMSR